MVRPENAEELEAAFAAPREQEERAFVRSKFDPLGPSALEKEPVNPLQVAGQVFIITDGEPLCFWDITRRMMLGFGAPPKHVDKPKIVLPKTVGWFFAWAAEWVSWLTRKEATFTRMRVEYMCGARYYNIEKARRVLGYEPDVGTEEGIQKTLEVSLFLYPYTDLRPRHLSFSGGEALNNKLQRPNDSCYSLSLIYLLILSYISVLLIGNYIRLTQIHSYTRIFYWDFFSARWRRGISSNVKTLIGLFLYFY